MARRRPDSRAALAALAASGVLCVAFVLLARGPVRRRVALAAPGGSVVDIEGSTFARPGAVYERDLQQAPATAPARQDVGAVLQGIKAQQAAAEAQMKRLMQLNRAQASALSRALDGDRFSAGLAAGATAHAAPAKPKLHPRSGRPIAAGAARRQQPPAPAGTGRGAGGATAAAASSRRGAASGLRAAAAAVGNAQSDPGRVQTRIARLRADARARLGQDETRTIADLTTKPGRGPWFQAQQALSLDGDKRRVLGDQRLVKLLTGMEASPSLLPSQSAFVQHLDAIDTQARGDLQAAEMRARQRGVADEVNPNSQHMLAAGVNAGHSSDFGLGGMEGDDEDIGTQVLQRAGIRTDALPGFGTEVGSCRVRVAVLYACACRGAPWPALMHAGCALPARTLVRTRLPCIACVEA